MKLTRNTKLYKASDGTSDVEVICRSLTMIELKVIDNMKSHFHKCETAFQLSHVSGDTPNFFAQQQIGNDILQNSNIQFYNQELFELTVEEMRHTVKEDNTLDLITHITQNFPGTSLDYLFNLTFVDLVELGALCEKITNKKIFTISGSNASNININENTGAAQFDEDDGKSMQDKMKELANF